MGRTAKIDLAVNRKGRQFALKIFKLTNPTNDQATAELVRKEVAARCMLSHKHIPKYFGCRQRRTLKKADGTQIPVTYIVEEPVLNGELFDHLMNAGGFSEKMCRHLFKQMLDGVRYVHEQGYAHRDLKLENILLDKNYSVKLIDFGFASKLAGRDESGLMKTCCGTPNYMAPEIHQNKKYKGESVDVFALGVVLFAMRACSFPFHT